MTLGGKGGKGRFSAPEFCPRKAAYALPVGEVSQPVLSPFGFHLIKIDSKKGDTLSLRHILVRITPNDSAMTRPRQEGRLALEDGRCAGGRNEAGQRLAHKLNLPIFHATTIENEPAMIGGQIIPSVSAWAFGGAKPGEISEMFDDETGYYVARLPTPCTKAAIQKFENVKDQVRMRVAAMRGRGGQACARAGSTKARQCRLASAGLDAAAQQAGKAKVESRRSRSHAVRWSRDFGQFTEAVGAAFALPCRRNQWPVKTDNGVYGIRGRQAHDCRQRPVGRAEGSPEDRRHYSSSVSRRIQMCPPGSSQIGEGGRPPQEDPGCYAPAAGVVS